MELRDGKCDSSVDVYSTVSFNLLRFETKRLLLRVTTLGFFHKTTIGTSDEFTLSSER
jgi:hypothetical protein